MENQPSKLPRDIATKAALNDAAALAAMAADEYQATYAGPDRAAYLRVLATWVADLGGALEDGPASLAATFAGRRISVRFGPLSGHG